MEITNNPYPEIITADDRLRVARLVQSFLTAAIIDRLLDGTWPDRVVFVQQLSDRADVPVDVVIRHVDALLRCAQRRREPTLSFLGEALMFLDLSLRVCNQQAFTAVAVSTNSIDLGNTTPARRLGSGEPIGFGISIDVGLIGTNMTVEIVSAADPNLTVSVVSHVTRTFVAADAPAGALHFIALPMGAPTQRYLGLRVTPVGGAATVTLTAQLTAVSAFSIAATQFPKSSVA